MTLLEFIITSISYIKHPAKRKCLQLSFLFKNKKGLEVGGPSAFFHLKTPLPIYAWAQSMDGVNFSNSTLWEGALLQGVHYHYYKNKSKHIQRIANIIFFTLILHIQITIKK